MVATNAGTFLNIHRLDSFERQVGFCPGKEKGALCNKSAETFEINISPIHQVKGTTFQREGVQNIDIMTQNIGQLDKGGNRSLEIHQYVRLDHTFRYSEAGPGKQRQAEVDGGTIERIKNILQVQGKAGIHQVQLSGLGYEYLSKILIDPTIPLFIGVS